MYRATYRHTVFFLLFIVTTIVSAAPSQNDIRAWYHGIEIDSPATRDGLTAAERARVLALASHHKVASLEVIDKYDPTGAVGFCFGRAMTTQIFARKLGLRAESIRKLFIVGDLRDGGDQPWRFHVTTLVRGEEDGEYYAIDPILPGLGKPIPVKAAEWIKTIRSRWDRDKKANLFLSKLDTVMPDMRILPAKDNETGEHLIEFKFTPATHPEFTAMTIGESTVYSMTPQGELDHFLRVDEPRPEDEFPFLKLSIVVLKGPEKLPRTFEFNGYFADLLGDLKTPGIATTTRTAILRAAGTGPAASPVLGFNTEE